MSIFLVSLIFVFSIVFIFVNKRKEVLEEENVKGEVDIVGVPYIVNTAPVSAYIGEEYLFLINISDSDSDFEDLDISLLEGPSWLFLEDNSLVGTPSEDDKGTYKVSLKVSDGKNSSTKEGYILVE